MNRTRTFRFLRIAASVVCLLASLVLIRFWVSSHYTPMWMRVLSPHLTILSWQGVVTVNPGHALIGPTRQQTSVARITYWSLVLAAGTLAALPWVTWYRQFRLRAFLVTMTLIAVVLGLVMASH